VRSRKKEKKSLAKENQNLSLFCENGFLHLSLKRKKERKNE
jgi:hypothetical protein